MIEPSLALQATIGNALAADPAVSALVSAEHIRGGSMRPEDFPCIIMGGGHTEFLGNASGSQYVTRVSCDVHIWSQEQGADTAKAIGFAVMNALKQAPVVRMMRAGKLNRVIFIDRLTTSLNENRTPVSTWTNIATLRAEVLQHSVDERKADNGERDTDSTTFRTRFFTGLTTADRIRFMGSAYNVKGWTEIGIRSGLEIKAVAA